jgi:hypothetical protein
MTATLVNINLFEVFVPGEVFIPFHQMGIRSGILKIYPIVKILKKEKERRYSFLYILGGYIK